MNIKFIIYSTNFSTFNYEESVVIKGRVLSFDLCIDRQFQLKGNEYEGWDLWFEDRLIERMPLFDYEQSYAPFKWMLGYLNAQGK